MNKILLVGPSIGEFNRGGVSVYNKFLIKNMLNYQYSIDYFPYFIFNSKIVSKNNQAYRKEYLMLRNLISFIFYIKNNTFDAIHVSSGLTRKSILRDSLYSFIAKFQGLKLILSIHGWKDDEFEKIQNNFLWTHLLKKFISIQDRILVLSEYQCEKIKESGFDEKKITVTSTMVDTQIYNPSSSKFKSKTKYVLFCGGLIKSKGIYEFIHSIKKVVKERSDIKFIVMGSGPALKDVVDIIRNDKIEDFVILTGHIEGKLKIKIFESSSIFVLPSYTEGFPNVILEAFSAGNAVVTTLVGALKDFFGKENGLIINSNPPSNDEISEKILDAFSDIDKLRFTAQQNRELSKKKYDSKVVSKKISTVYRSLLNE